MSAAVSSFYFCVVSDCWTMQELLITLEVLNEGYTTDYVTSFADNNGNALLNDRIIFPFHTLYDERNLR